MEKQEKNKKDGYAGWRRFRNRFNTVLIIFALITLYCSFYFVGPIRGKVVDAKTGEPIANIRVDYDIDGDDLCLNPGGCGGWGKNVKTYTDNNGKFKIPFSIALKIPFIQWLKQERRISAREEYGTENKKYDSYEETFVWFPFRSFKFALVPVPETLDDCRDNLTEKEQYRCVEMLAGRDAGEINKIKNNAVMDDYFLGKYLHILNNYCANNDAFYCLAVRAFYQKDKNICNNDSGCLFAVAIDLREKSWCEELPAIKDPYLALSRENCEYIIDTLDNK